MIGSLRGARPLPRLFRAAGALAVLAAAGPAAGSGPLELAAVIHVHSTFSTGRYTPGELAAKAKALGLDILVLTDHDRVAVEYGLPPFRRLFKLAWEHPSVLRIGPELYLEEIARLNAGPEGLRVIPGVQSSPFYFWSGSPWDGSLTAHNLHKELLLVGMTRPEDYRGLPILHNGFSPAPVRGRIAVFAAAAGFLVAAVLFFVRARGRTRRAAAVIALVGLAAVLDRHPFASSRHDPYRGDPGIGPYQEVIDYVGRRGGLVFWAHPESNYPVAGLRLGPVTLATGHYAGDLARAHGYTGFAALYGDTDTVAAAGGLWDAVLSAYCRGERAAPVFAVAEADFHAEAPGQALDTYLNILRAASRELPAVVEALRRGRFYAVEKGVGWRLVLSRFEVRDTASGRAAAAGDELAAAGPVRVALRIEASDGLPREAAVDLVRDGVRVEAIAGVLPIELETDGAALRPGRGYYRLAARGAAGGRLVSNPVFVRGPAEARCGGAS
jgi:hypothetical protein